MGVRGELEARAMSPVAAALSASLHVLVVALSVVIVANAPGGGTDQTTGAIGMTVLFVTTYVVGIRPDWTLPAAGRRGWWWVAVLSVEWLVLLWLTADATYLVFALFFLYLRLLGAVWGTVVVALTTAVAVLAFGLSNGFAAGGVIGPILGAGVAVVIGLGYQALTREALERQHLIEELTRTRDQLAAAERAAGVADERERLAREIHDTVSQSLSSIILLLHAAQRSGPDSTSGQVRLEQARAAASDALAETREFIHALAPPALRTGGVAQALARLAQQTADATALQVEVTVPQETGVLPTPVEVALLRVAQNALANVTQHAHATRVDLTLTRLDDTIVLDVVDDGVGFDPTELTTRPGSDRRPFGLVVMRDRVADLGGTLVVESSRGHGTNVVASFAVST